MAGFRTVVDQTFDLGAFNVFIGANGAGKSSVLDAIGMLGATADAVLRGTSGLAQDAFIARGVRGDVAPRARLGAAGATGLYAVRFPTAWEGTGLAQDHALLEALRHFVIYDPHLDVLRGEVPDSTGTTPMGLRGGQLLDAARFTVQSGPFAAEAQAALDEWGGPDVRARLLDADSDDRAWSDGTRFLFFALVLLFHPHVPRFFGVEHLDRRLHPRLAQRVLATFADRVVASGAQVLLTTHAPSVLDALDLADDAVRLYAVERAVSGETLVQRIVWTEAVEQARAHGLTLSQLWMRGLLGAVPDFV